MKKAAWLLFMFLIWTGGILSQQYQILGEDEGEGELISPGQIMEGPEGNIYIADYGDYFIKVYSSEGKYLRRLGGRGEGPGEMKRMGRFGFTWDRKKLFFTEFWGGHRWITLMKPTGEFDRVIRITFEKQFGALEAVSLKNGYFILRVSFRNTAKQFGDYFLQAYPNALLHLSPSGEVQNVIIQRSHFHRISPMKSGADGPIWFTPIFSWIFHKDKITFTEGLSSDLALFNVKGKKIGTIPTSIPPAEPVTDADHAKRKKAMIQSLQYRPKDSWYQTYTEMLKKYKKSYHKVKPNLSGISTTPEQNFLLSGPYEEGQKQTLWLIDQTGQELVQLKLKARGIRISNHFVFFSIEDEEEETHICYLKRRGSELEDLLRLAQILQL
jgi:hypothetical protein